MAKLTPKQLRILATLPEVIEAVKAFRAQSDELLGLLGPNGAPAPAPRLQTLAPPIIPPMATTPTEAEEQARAAALEQLARRQARALEPKTAEQIENEQFLAAEEGKRKALLGQMLGGGGLST